MRRPGWVGHSCPTLLTLVLLLNLLFWVKQNQSQRRRTGMSDTHEACLFTWALLDSEPAVVLRPTYKASAHGVLADVLQLFFQTFLRP